jgi:hypothetical protein
MQTVTIGRSLTLQNVFWIYSCREKVAVKYSWYFNDRFINVILKWILECVLWAGFIWLRVKRRVTGFCEYGNESSSFIKNGYFSDHMKGVASGRILWPLFFVRLCRTAYVAGGETWDLAYWWVRCPFVEADKFWNSYLRHTHTHAHTHVQELIRDNQIRANISGAQSSTWVQGIHTYSTADRVSFTN